MKKPLALLLFFIFVVTRNAIAQTEPVTETTSPFPVTQPVSDGGHPETDVKTSVRSFDDFATLSLDDLLNQELLSATKMKLKARNAPSIITVIPNEQFEQYGWLSIDEVLTKQPGFFPARDYDRNTVGSRGSFEGWNNNHLLILVDGIPVNDNLYGSAYTWRITPLVFTKSMEVIRGPGAALYGTNAMNGVVSLNTYSAADLKHKNLFRAGVGDFNTRMAQAVAGVQGDKVDAVFAFSAFQTAGNPYSSYDGSYRGASTTGTSRLEKFHVRDDQAGTYFFAKVEGKEKFDGLSLQYHHQEWKFQTGHGWLWWIPDLRESMQEERNLLSVAYRPMGSDAIHPEFVLQYQRHDIDWNMRYYPNDAFGAYYPSGGWEYLKTNAQSLFGRAQVTYDALPKDMALLAGVEGNQFHYRGDDAHFTNLGLLDAAGGYPPNPEGRMSALGPWLESIQDHPVTIGTYLQHTSGSLLGKYVNSTLGVRYDSQFFSFQALDKPGAPEESKSFSQLSPRLGFVVAPTDALSFKLLAGRAFRTPSPTEMFGANTWTLASNLRQLKPEVITTGEVGSDYKVNKYLNWRVNGYYTRFENQIAYSIGNANLSTNIYSLSTAGVETELHAQVRDLSGFANYSFAKRVDEKIFPSEQPYVSPSENRLTWAPSHLANVGLSYEIRRLGAGLIGHYQGVVLRREKDLWDPASLAAIGLTQKPRSDAVPAWFSLDTNVGYRLGLLKLGVTITNLLDRQRTLVKNLRYPFDYQMEGRRVLGKIDLLF